MNETTPDPPERGLCFDPLERGLCVGCARLNALLLKAEQRLASLRGEAIGDQASDPDRISDRQAMETQCIDQSIERARVEALGLFESLLAAHARAIAIDVELKREIQRREQLEAALRTAEQRYRRLIESLDQDARLAACDQTIRRLIDSANKNNGT